MAERNPHTKQYEFNPYAAGARRYAGGTSMAPTSGPVSTAGKAGYAERDRKKRAKKAALNNAISTTWRA